MNASQQKIKEFENSKEKTFKSFQELGSVNNGKSFTEQEAPYSPYQNDLYKRALYGVKAYTEEELKTMHYHKQKRIKKLNFKAQKEINMLKQERIIKATNKIFSWFHNSPLASDLINMYSEPDPDFITRKSFRDLDITKDEVIDRLIEKAILPKNFHSLEK